jgi:hypothetical protein
MPVYGQVPWWDLPSFYLNAPISEPTLERALEYAAMLDPDFAGADYRQMARECLSKPVPPISPLTPDQAAAITCYTGTNSLFQSVNNALRRFSVDLILAWAPFLQVCFTSNILFLIKVASWTVFSSWYCSTKS